MIYQFDHGGNVFDMARLLGITADQVLDFSASINPLGMSAVVRSALLSSLDSIVHYPDASHSELKQALARTHAISAEHFSIANGSTTLIYNLPVILHGRKALIISPAFSEYERALSLHGWDVRHFILAPENNFVIDTEKLEIVLAEGFDAMYVCNPGNPSGTLYPLALIKKIYELCHYSGTFMVLDEAFMDFCEEASAKFMIADCDDAVILRSMTKFYGIPGLRLGYAISGASLAGKFGSMMGPWGVNTLALVSGVAALEDVQHNVATVEYVNSEKSRIMEAVSRLPHLKVYPSHANYLLVELKNGYTALELKKSLLLHRILIRDCSTFTGLTDCFFRMAVRTSQENDRLLESMAKVFV